LTKSDPNDLNGVDNDFDNDGVVDSLESVIGTSTTDPDSDDDGIPDGYELLGNEGWSMSENRTPDAHLNPTMRNLYVEADWMPSSGAAWDRSKEPYANIANDVANLFTNETAAFAAGQRVSIDLRKDGVVPYTQTIKLYDSSCPNSPDPNCVHFNTLKATYFRPDVFYRHYAHYVIFANIMGDTGIGGCRSGRAEMLGNDLVVTLPQRDAGGNPCLWIPSSIEQRGTVVHELGHNINQTHNGNDSASNTLNSVVHASVMNYRYQTLDQPGAPANAAHYSHGSGGCAACASSPKAVCVFANSIGGCANPAYVNCDCDLNEWSTLNLDFFEGSDFADGSSGGATATYPMGETPAAGAARRRAGSEKDLTQAVESRPLPKESAQHRRTRVQQRMASLQARGLEQGKDFVRSDDGEHLYSVCQ
jgi:hypothetical protein